MNVKLSYMTEQGGKSVKKTKPFFLMFIPHREEVIAFQQEAEIVKDTGKELWTVLAIKHVFAEEGYLFTEVRISPVPDQVTQ